MLLVLLIGTTFILASSVGGNLRCDVTGVGGPQVNVPCTFPFVYDGTEFDACTSHGDPDNALWCSTQTDESGQHIGGGQGFWGYCDASCEERPIGVTSANSASTLTRTETPRQQSSSEETTSSPLTSTTARTAVPEDYYSDDEEIYEVPQLINATDLSPSNPSSELGDWLPDPEALECGFRTSVGYILGGTVSKRGEFPFTALLGFGGLRGNGENAYLCGGALINRRYVLTAAHCHDPLDAFESIDEVVLGEFDVSRDPDCKGCLVAQRFKIHPPDVKQHEGWNKRRPQGGHDIALIRLPRLAITIFENSEEIVAPVCLNWKDSPGVIGIDNENYVIGWGRTSNSAVSGDLRDHGVATKLMRKLGMQLASMEQCEDEYDATLVPYYTCAGGDKGQDSCNGDSGGPLISRKGVDETMFLTGLVSFGTERCGVGVPAVFANIKFYMPWIRQNLRP